MQDKLIMLKRKMYYLLSNIPPKDITESEKALFAVLYDDIELQAELVYIEYMKGE